MGSPVIAGGSSNIIDHEVEEDGEEVERLGIVRVGDVEEVGVLTALIIRSRRQGRRSRGWASSESTMSQRWELQQHRS